MMKKIELHDTLIKQLMGVDNGQDDVLKLNESKLSNAGKETFFGGRY